MGGLLRAQRPCLGRPLRAQRPSCGETIEGPKAFVWLGATCLSLSYGSGFKTMGGTSSGHTLVSWGRVTPPPSLRGGADQTRSCFSCVVKYRAAIVIHIWRRRSIVARCCWSCHLGFCICVLCRLWFCKWPQNQLQHVIDFNRQFCS